MTTYKSTLINHNSGANSVLILVGENRNLWPKPARPADAIKQTFERKYGVKVLSVTQPFGDAEYHIEHTGREASLYRNGRMTIDKVFSDRVTNLEQIKGA